MPAPILSIAMEAPEVPMEDVQKHIEHHAHESQEKWVSRVALSTAILAALAAVASLLAGDHENESMIARIELSDQWSFYQAKGIKLEMRSAKLDMLKSMGQTIGKEDEADVIRYAKEQEEIKKEAEGKAKETEFHLRKSAHLSQSVTMFQIAIAVGAISILTKRRPFWIVSIVMGAIGIVFLLQGLLTV